MAATYGYGGEFSSDEDIDRVEQNDRLQSKFDSFGPEKPTRHQIEEAIESIRSLPLDQDVLISDEIIAGLLDYYKTQRGPIVNSTRNLYKKIILRLIREGQPQATNGDGPKDSNGNSNNNNNVIVADLQQQQPGATASSDEDEPMPSASQSSVDALRVKKKFDSRVVQDSDNLEPMEVDSEEPRLGIRSSKQVDTSSEDDDDVSETEESDEDDVAPVKPTQVVPKAAIVTPAASQKALSDSAKKPQPKGTKESSTAEASKKKPYTRSQRQAAAASKSSSSSNKEEKKIDSSNKEQPASVKALSKSSLTSYESFFRALRKIKIDEPFRLNLMENENNEIVLDGTTINGRRLNYAEKMVLTAMFKHRLPFKNRHSTSVSNRVS